MILFNGHKQIDDSYVNIASRSNIGYRPRLLSSFSGCITTTTTTIRSQYETCRPTFTFTPRFTATITTNITTNITTITITITTATITTTTTITTIDITTTITITITPPLSPQKVSSPLSPPLSRPHHNTLPPPPDGIYIKHVHLHSHHHGALPEVVSLAPPM